MKITVGEWFAAVMISVLVLFVFGVVWGEPVAHDPAASPWQWFWRSYGEGFIGGALAGTATASFLVWRYRQAGDLSAGEG
jgi:hypothetical protein